MAKHYAATLEYEGKFPTKPGDGTLQSIKHSLKKAIGVQLASSSGWRSDQIKIHPLDEENKFKLIIGLQKHTAREFKEEMAEKQVEQIKIRLSERLVGWRRVGEVGHTDDDNEELDIATLLDIPDDWKIYFDHIYERDVQINEVMEVIRVARDSDMSNRNHVLLYGPPGCGKTEILLSLREMFTDAAVLFMDATSTTKAGMTDLLLKSDYVPPIIAIEELEKVASENDIPYLLSLMDNRAEIIKTNARIGRQSRQAKSIIVASCNNMEKLKSFHDSALLDRFNVPVYVPLPSDDLIRKILSEQLEKIPNGNPAWIDKTIDYAKTIEKTYQLRRIKAIMSIGKDRLLDGSFQQEHEALITQRQRDYEKLTEFVK